MSQRSEQGNLKAATKAARRRANAAPEIEVAAVAEAVLQERLDTFSDTEKTSLEEAGRRVLTDAETKGDTGFTPYAGAKGITSENADLHDYMLIGFAAMVAGKQKKGRSRMAPPGTAVAKVV